jgi:hypothetical protein
MSTLPPGPGRRRAGQQMRHPLGGASWGGTSSCAVGWGSRKNSNLPPRPGAETGTRSSDVERAESARVRRAIQGRQLTVMIEPKAAARSHTTPAHDKATTPKHAATAAKTPSGARRARAADVGVAAVAVAVSAEPFEASTARAPPGSAPGAALVVTVFARLHRPL